MVYRANKILPSLAKEICSYSPKKLQILVLERESKKISRASISMWFSRHKDIKFFVDQLQAKKIQTPVHLEKRNIKHLLFKLQTKEYSDFWYVGSLLDKSNKKEIFLEMIKIIKDLRSDEREETRVNR